MLIKPILASAAALGLLAVAAIPGLAGAQTGDKELSALEIKAMLQNMGHEIKDLVTDPGKEKVEFKVANGGYDVYIAAEVSASKRYIWLTSFLGEADKVPGMDAKARKFLERNVKIQPSQFYITEKGNLMMAIAIDNHGVNPAVLKFRIDKLAADVASTDDLWKQ